MKPALLIAALLAIAGPALAQTPKPAADPQPGPFVDPDQVPAGTYVLDSKEALVRYTTIHMGLTEFWGTFPNASGTLTIDPKNLAATKVDIKVPVLSLETTNKELNAEFISSEFFDFGKFRTIHFVSTGVTRTGPRTAKMTGDLTVHGVTRPVTFNVTFNNAGPNSFSKVLTLGFKAEGVVKRSEFGLGKYVPIVSDDTTITISAAFEQKAPGKAG
ncbi:YceI family protein [Phenylobacterium sp.]|jgi:polyisoprenoid-binding protein YceI|uniref:YceI family protein n=1 Tax=Phenylobacterium sp. TaxID=1871053 RepID=UPI002F42A051